VYKFIWCGVEDTVERSSPGKKTLDVYPSGGSLHVSVEVTPVRHPKTLRGRWVCISREDFTLRFRWGQFSELVC
jgi:hypothetical protein